MLQCARPACQSAAKSSCSGCHREQYCGGDCQKLDWKLHKPMCLILKKLSKELQPYHEVVGIVNEILDSKKEIDLRVLDHLRLYAEFQFGKEIIGKSHRERDGERISNWESVIPVLININAEAVNYYEANALLKPIYDSKRLPHLERSLCLLRPYLVHLDSNSNGRTDFTQVDYALLQLSFTERRMADMAILRNQFKEADGRCQRSLAYSKRVHIEGEKKIDSILAALRTYVDLRQHEGKYSSAIVYAEEAYNVVVVAYDCVHPKVQVAASKLINLLIDNQDFYNAERFAEVTYANLTDHKNGMN
jgi:hypothetical protein